MTATFWAFVPAIIAIALALITKQVYISLFFGIFVGAMFVAEGNILVALSRLYEAMASELGGGAWILVFLVMLGILVVLMTKAGGSRAYGEWASRKIKTRRGAMLSTVALGSLIFVDDYFNCLTVGNVMRPITDKFKVSRAKLAYLIDATAAPICIIAPISSWAAAVSEYTDGNGILMFIKTIPFNLYALLTIGMVITLCCLKFDFFKMRKNEKNAVVNNDLYSGATDLPAEDVGNIKINSKGKVIDLVLPVVALIIFCVGSMIFTGYFFNYDAGKVIIGEVQSANILEAFGNCNAGLSLAIGSTLAVVFTAIMYLTTRVLNFKDFTDSFVQGFKSMVPAILILILAWTLSSICSELGLAEYVEKVMGNSSSMAHGIIPAVFFLVAAGISFATGTSWGTFGILIPIALVVAGADSGSTMGILSISAILAGSVFGDHVSPISDTTILSSSGAQCNHVDHVNTQLPYASSVAIVAFITYIISGFIAQSGMSYGATAAITLAIGFVLMGGVLAGIYLIEKKRGLLLSKSEIDNALASNLALEALADSDDEDAEKE